MNKEKFFNYKPSINLKARICLPERIFNYFCEEWRINYAPLD